MQVRRQVGLLRSLPELSPSERRSLVPLFAAQARRRADWQADFDASVILVLGLEIAVWVAVLVAIGTTFVISLESLRSPVTLVTFLFVYAASGAAFMVAPIGPTWGFSFSYPFLAAYSTLVAGLEVSLSLWLLHNHMQTIFPAGVGLAAGGLLGAASWALLQPLLAAFALNQRFLHARFPLELIAEHLVASAAYTPKQGPWATTARLVVVSGLEQTAVIVETRLVKVVAPGDAATHVWLSGEATRIATAIRRWKRDALLPAPSRETLKTVLTKCAACAIRGELAGLEAIDPDAKPVTTSWLRSTVVMAARVGGGVLPLLVFILVQHSAIALKDPYAAVATTVLVVWALLTLVAIDPLFGSKLGTLAQLRESAAN